MDAKDIAEDLQETNLIEEGEDLTKSEESPPEKMLPASRVNELVKKAKYAGERKMQEQLDAIKQENEQLKAQLGQPQVQQQTSATPQQGLDQEALQKLVMPLIEKQQQEIEQKKYQEQLEQEVNQVAKQYFGKMAQGKDLYEDFDAITADFNPAEFPQLVFLANQLDNTAAVIYELRKNPGKLAQLATLVKESPSIARSELNSLSNSIKRNDEAKRNLQEPQDPLNRLKPSPVGTDSGQKTVRDYKSASYLKG